MLGAKPEIKLAAIDSSGFEARHVSQYFLQRQEPRGVVPKSVFARFFPKLTLICDCKTHLILSFLTTKGPKPDNPTLEPALNKCMDVAVINRLLGDAGYDGEPNHIFARSLGIKAFFPPLIGAPSTKPPKGKYRRLMKQLFRHPKNIKYGQRWQVETVMSLLKRRFTTATKARTTYSRYRELALLVLTYNLAVICLLNYLFYRAGRSPFLK